MQSKYEVLGLVGEGSYGVVYKCKNKKNGEFVAIKKFKEEEDEMVKKTISRELRVLQILKHDNIVEFKEAFKMKGNLFLVFEYVEKNLLELLQEHPKGLEPGLIKKIIYQLCKSVKYLHDMNIVHRDIKPENLLVDENYKLKLCDFGFARTIKISNKEKLTDYVATRWYRSPELLITSGYYGPEIDYWAIGCIMGELVDGDPLFPGDNEIDQLNVIQKVIGKFEDYQYELFYNNPNFKNAKLIQVTKPETLERRYLGKLSKTAISFMKQLLHPDSKQRLNGSNVFSHQYFENYSDPFPSKETVDCNSIVNKPPPNTVTNLAIKPKSLQPIISNTTNINIINVNGFEKSEKNEKNKILDKLNNGFSNNMVLTSYNFNQNTKENMLSMYGSTSLDKNFKTFYKGDPYNFDISLNYLNKGKKEVEKVPNANLKNKTSNFKMKHDLDMYRTDFDKSNSPNKKKSDTRAKNTSIIPEENYQKASQSKLPNIKLIPKNFKDFQLPYINNKNFLNSQRKK